MEHRHSDLIDIIVSSASTLGFDVPPSSYPLFETYLAELKHWNRSINLTAIHDDREVAIKHVVDSLAGLKVLRLTNDVRLLDIGTGAGFPAIPLKLMSPALSIMLLEPSEKKSAFLRYVSGMLGLEKVAVASEKIDSFAGNERNSGAFDYIVVRAFKVDGLGALLRRLLKTGGKVVLYRASKIEKGFELDGLALIDEVEYELPFNSGHRVLSVFSA